MSSSEPSVSDLREARDAFSRLLKARAKESNWQSFFARYPYVLSRSLPLKIATQDIIPLGRPGRSEADLVFYPRELSGFPTYGVIELKHPKTQILSIPRRNTFILSRDSATAIAQAKGYAKELGQKLIKEHGANLFVGNSAQVFLILGLSDELASKIPSDIARDTLDGLFPADCKLIPYDTLLSMFEDTVPPLLVSLNPTLIGGQSNALISPLTHDSSIKEQLPHQNWGDPKRHSIKLECPPGDPRPSELFKQIIARTGLFLKDFDLMDRPFFGAQEFLVKPNPDSIHRFREAQPMLKKIISELYEKGSIRAGSWG